MPMNRLTVEPRETILTAPMTGAAAMHVLVLRVWSARDEYDVFGWTPDTPFTRQDVLCRFEEMMEVLDNYVRWLVVHLVQGVVIVSYIELMDQVGA